MLPEGIRTQWALQRATGNAIWAFCICRYWVLYRPRRSIGQSGTEMKLPCDHNLVGYIFGFIFVVWNVFNWCVRLFFHPSHLVQHLNTVLTEPIVVVGFPWSPVSEGHHVFIRPGEHTSHNQVIQTGPHVTRGCKGQKNKLTKIIIFNLYLPLDGFIKSL